MKSFRKITAWAMALAISSTATAVTAFAEGNAVTTDVPAASEPVSTEPVSTDIVTTEAIIATTTASTENISAVTTAVPTTPVVSPVVSAVIGPMEVRVDTTTKDFYIKDNSTGHTVDCKGSTVNISGTILEETVDTEEVTDPTDEQTTAVLALLDAVLSKKVDTIVYADSVTDIKCVDIDGSMMTENVSITFGKNIKTITPDLLKDVTSKVTIYGYKGTAAETFAASNNATFVALDESVSTNVTYEASAVTTTATTVTATDAATTKKATTATKKATTKKATTTAKASDSPKTGDAGVGLIAGVLALSAVTGAFALRKKDNE